MQHIVNKTAARKPEEDSAERRARLCGRAQPQEPSQQARAAPCPYHHSSCASGGSQCV